MTHLERPVRNDTFEGLGPRTGTTGATTPLDQSGHVDTVRDRHR